ncbi:MAG: adenylyltransferase/cytidyltransferase family protein [Candidatus Yanofskybacteria bacterium]|nr:adenylyltransferase/cytidyltransferase family protein [Candidatus Yanofskybacteria bacterium]
MIFDLKNESDIDLINRAVSGKVIGLTSGSYDLFHHLHLVYLKRCRRYCDLLIVGVDSDDLVRIRKGSHRPLVPEHQRVAIVSELSCVGGAFILGSVEDFEQAVRLLSPVFIFKNDEFKEEEVLGRDKAKVIIIPDIIQYSSTSQIIEEILKRKIPEKS